MIKNSPYAKFDTDTVVDVLVRRASELAEKTAFAFLANGEDVESQVTYSQLLTDVRRVANALVRQGAMPGDRVLLLFPSGIDFVTAFFGCLYAGTVAVPAYPPTRAVGVLEGIAAGCSPRFVLGNDSITDRVFKKFPDSSLLQLPWTKTSEWTGGEILGSDPLRHACALLQYTSGSTGAPKGVILNHDNLMANQAAIQHAFSASSRDVLVGWLPPYHDMGLIGNLIQTVYLGATLYFMAPMTMIEDPFRWLKAVSRFKATASGGPNFAYNLCVDRITPAQIEQLDLRAWELAFCGAEPVHAAMIERFAEKFDPCGFSRSAFTPCYGLAEGTLMVTTTRRQDMPVTRHVSAEALTEHRILGRSRKDPDAKSFVSCGSVPPDHDVAIVDPTTGKRCTGNQVGEIWVRGPSVSPGYFEDPVSTEATFGGELDGAGPYLRTGDLGAFNDGHLFITGRQKDVIVLRGRNYYPNDIEAVASTCHPKLVPDGAVAFELATSEGAQLAMVLEVSRQGVKDLPTEELVTAVRKAVSQEFQIDVHSLAFIGPRQLPRTSSGKVRRRDTRKMYLSGELSPLAISNADRQAAAPNDEELSQLQEDVRKELAAVVNMHPTTVRLQTPLVELGVDSIHALEVIHRVKKRYGLALTAEDFFDGLSLGSLCTRITSHAPELRHSYVAPSGSTAAVDAMPKLPRQTPIRLPINGNNGLEVNTPRRRREAESKSGMQFSLMYFASDGSADSENHNRRYELLLSSAEFGDRRGFSSVWIPERHFHRFGGLYPNPSVVAAAVAARTSRIRIRAGSVVLPLHQPVRVAEEWSIVDNLSDGRVDLAFAQGWNPNDFVLAPRNYENRLELMYEGIETIRTLWRGGQVTLPNGKGGEKAVSVFPAPVQNDLAVWITCSGTEDRFAQAGAAGANILTALLFQDRSELKRKIDVYRQARKENGFDPDTGHVTLMLHTSVGDEMGVVRERVKGPLKQYLRDSVDLWRQSSTRLEDLTPEEQDEALNFAFERYFRTHALCGTPEGCMPMVQELYAMGVNEIACLLDFGVPYEDVMASLWSLASLKDACSNLKRPDATLEREVVTAIAL